MISIHQHKDTPFSDKSLRDIIAQYPTPFYIYDKEGIIQNAQHLNNAFSWVSNTDGSVGGYKNYFAVKALPNPHILSILKQQGMGVDCSSLAELVLAERCGYGGHDIFFSSNNTPIEEYRKAITLGAYINLDDIYHLDYLKSSNMMPDSMSFRYNPGSAREGNRIIGAPEESKFGVTREQIFEAYPKAHKYGVRHFGLHTMVASNELRPEYFIQTAEMLFELACEVHARTNIRIECINLGGGMGIAYRPNDTPLDYSKISDGIRSAYNKHVIKNNLHPMRVVSENGRIISGPYGYLISRVRHCKQTYKHFVGLDATMANLMRPGMYGAYHHVSVLGKAHSATHMYDVTGSLCENNDKFAIDRLLPHIEVGDVVVIHDVGAHGHAMGFNYNGKLRCAELLYSEGEIVTKIRNAETLENYFATIDF